MIGHQRMKNRCGVRQSSRLDHDSIEPQFPFTRITTWRVAQGLHQVASNRATETTTRHLNNRVVLADRHKIMIQADLPEFVDDHQRPVEHWLPDKVVQDGRLSAAQKSRQHRDR